MFESCQGPKGQRQRWIIDASENTQDQQPIKAHLLSISTGLFMFSLITHMHGHTSTHTVTRPIHIECLLTSSIILFADESFSSTWCDIHAPKVEVLVLNFQKKHTSYLILWIKWINSRFW